MTLLYEPGMRLFCHAGSKLCAHHPWERAAKPRHKWDRENVRRLVAAGMLRLRLRWLADWRLLF